MSAAEFTETTKTVGIDFGVWGTDRMWRCSCGWKITRVDGARFGKTKEDVRFAIIEHRLNHLEGRF